MRPALARSAKVLAGLLQKAGPYLLLELLLPGGTLFALLLFLCRREEVPGARIVLRLRARVAGALARMHERVGLLRPAYGVSPSPDGSPPTTQR